MQKSFAKELAYKLEGNKYISTRKENGCFHLDLNLN